MSVVPNSSPALQAGNGINLNGLDGNFSAKLSQLVDAVRKAGGSPQVTSGYRTYQQQDALYKSGNGGVPVARPGSSLHEQGLAADVTGDANTVRLLHSMAPQFGLSFPMANDPVHVQLAGASSGGGGGVSSAGAAGYMTPQGQNVSDYISQNYGWAAAYLNVPEVGDLIRRAAEQQWGLGQLQQAIYSTNWYKSHNEAQRSWEALVASNPGEADSKVRAQMAHITDSAARLGVNISGDQNTDIATRSLREGWTPDQLNDALIMLAKTPANLAQSGSVPATMSALKQQANNYGVNLSDQTLFDMAWHIGAGEQTIEGYTPQFQQWAKQKYTYWAPQIDAGFTVAQLADPYKQDAAKLLEVAPESIDLFNNPQFSQALAFHDPKTNENRAMTLSEWQTYLRGTDQWKGTQQGQQAASGMAEGLLNAFGKVKSGLSGFGG